MSDQRTGPLSVGLVCIPVPVVMVTCQVAGQQR